MIESAKYIKIVEWSDEDECFIGYCPGIIGPCCHGDDEVEVYRQLCEIVDELLEHAQKKINLFRTQLSVGTLKNS
jgi:predicted RNase H-like HicB family nuclease